MSYRSPIIRKRKTASRPDSPKTATGQRRGVEKSPGRVVALQFAPELARAKHAPSYSYSGPASHSGQGYGGEDSSSQLRRPTRATTGQRRPSPEVSDRGLQSAPRHKRTTSLADSRVRPKETEDKLRTDNKKPERWTPLVSQFAHWSHVGFIPNNPGKVNQDAFIATINLGNLPDVYLFAVADGHGTNGHQVSGYIKHRLPILLSQETGFLTRPRKALNAAIVRCNAELTTLHVDITLSGSTLTAALVGKDKVWCANVGDSRTLLARNVVGPSGEPQATHWIAISLSRDHKPDDMDEAARILSSGGRIAAYKDEDGQPLGPSRVWLRNQDLPGLAMTRSMGDTIAASVGVTCVPEVADFTLTKDDKFLICGSDGVFEFMSNEEVVRTIVPFYLKKDVNGACDAVAREARKRWTEEEEVIDDITCLIAFLDV